MTLFGSYAPIGGGLMMFCELVVAVPGLLLLAFRVGFAPRQFRRPKWLVISVCFVQPVFGYCVLGELTQFSNYFAIVWLVSMALIATGWVLVAAWPEQLKGDKA